ncbi:jmjC domain-containing histone demethylation protein 1-like [Haemaphysalis longicornis]
MPRLVVLELWQVRDITLAGIEHVARIPTLRKLTLFECRNMTGLWLDILSTRPFPLYYLDISQCFQMDSTAVLSIATGPSLLGLTTLRMVGLRVKDYVLSFVAKKLTKLEHLDISKCKMITQEGIGALATHLPGLRVLNMRFTTHLRDGTFRHLCRMPCLETVNLKGCRRISGGGPRAIPYKNIAMLQLRYLNLSGCIISDRTISLIARRMRHLHTLRLVRCRQITDRSLEMIGTHMKDLRLIDLRANPRVSKTAKRNLTVALPQSIPPSIVRASHRAPQVSLVTSTRAAAKAQGYQD